MFAGGYSNSTYKLKARAAAGLVQSSDALQQPARFFEKDLRRHDAPARFVPLPDWFKAQCRTFAASAQPGEFLAP